jgi:hypothetical protein
VFLFVCFSRECARAHTHTQRPPSPSVATFMLPGKKRPLLTRRAAMGARSDKNLARCGCLRAPTFVPLPSLPSPVLQSPSSPPRPAPLSYDPHVCILIFFNNVTQLDFQLLMAGRQVWSVVHGFGCQEMKNADGASVVRDSRRHRPPVCSIGCSVGVSPFLFWGL